MTKYEEATWKDLEARGKDVEVSGITISPVAGLDAVTAKQLAQFLGVPWEVVSRQKDRYDKELRALGAFTAAPKKLASRMQILGRTQNNGFKVALEDGSTMDLYSGNTVYLTAPAACRLADVISGVNDDKRPGRRKAESSKTRAGAHPKMSPSSPPLLQVLERGAGAEREKAEGTGDAPGRSSCVPLAERPQDRDGLQVFSNPDFGSIRALEIDGEPWLVGKDVAEALGYSNPRDAIAKHVDLEDKNTVAICDGTPGNPDVVVVNESGLYSLVFSSHLPDAKKFKRWITHEVLPSIRKRGVSMPEKCPVYQDGAAIQTVLQGKCTDSEHERVEGLIPVTILEDQPSVSARDLHEFLEVGTRFNDWFQRMCEYGFSEGQDYYSFLSNRVDDLPGKPRQDAALSIDMAKEICMLQRNEKGKVARRYFIQLEKEWNSPEKVMARALQFANKKVTALEVRNDALDTENKALSREQLSWDYRAILVRLVRMYGSRVYGDFKAGWRAFFRELRYKEGISLNHRSGDGALIDRLVGDEWVRAVAVAASMCKSQDISFLWSVNEVNMESVS